MTELLNATKAAEILGLKKETFYRYVSAGKIDVHSRRGRGVFFHPEEIERYRKGEAKKQIVISKPKMSLVERNRQRIAELERTAKRAVVLNAFGEQIGYIERKVS